MTEIFKPKYIILHHSATRDGKTVSWDAIRRYHISRGWREIGYHFGIELIGNHYEILVGRMLNEIGAHCRGYNKIAVGICFLGNFEYREPATEQVVLGIKLIKALKEIFNISDGNILGHRNLAGTKCPGAKFPLNIFQK